MKHFNIKFSYNGNIGLLQSKSKSNMEFINILELNGIITIEEAKNLYSEVLEYYHDELSKELSRNYI